MMYILQSSVGAAALGVPAEAVTEGTLCSLKPTNQQLCAMAKAPPTPALAVMARLATGISAMGHWPLVSNVQPG